MEKQLYYRELAQRKHRFPKKLSPAEVELFKAIPAMPRKEPPSSGLSPYTGNWGYDQVIHLLRRTMFGATKNDVQYFKNMSMSAAVDELLSNESNPNPPVNDYNFVYEDDDIEDPIVPFGETWINAPYTDEVEYWRILSLKSWWLDRMLKQERSIHQKMILFWHNHFATEAFAVYHARISYMHYVLLFQNALGNFKTMTRAVTLDPQMLYYLNGAYNNKYQPDENYSRELQELFCLGAGSGYTENDVQEAARLLTGWTVNYNTINASTEEIYTYFNPYLHDNDDKQFSAFYDNTFIEGRINGEHELDDLMDMIFANEECAKFVCRKIYRFFVHQTINASVETNIIEPLATIFRDNNYDIIPVLSKLFKSQHFFDANLKGAIIKSPMDYMVGLFREFGVEQPANQDLADRYMLHITMNYVMSDMLQEVGDPPNVAGWPTYYQAPQFDRYWMTTNTMPRRAEHSDGMLYWGYYIYDNYIIRVDTVAFTEQIPGADDPNDLVNRALLLLLSVPVGDAVKAQLKNILLSGQISDHYWTDAWTNYLAEPSNEMYYGTVKTRLRAMYRTILQLEEYQLM